MSDELTEAERIAAGCIKHGVGASEDFPGNVCHLVSPVVGFLRLRERDGEDVTDLGHILDRLSLVLDMARQEAARVQQAEAERDARLDPYCPIHGDRPTAYDSCSCAGRHALNMQRRAEVLNV